MEGYLKNPKKNFASCRLSSKANTDSNIITNNTYSGNKISIKEDSNISKCEEFKINNDNNTKKWALNVLSGKYENGEYYNKYSSEKVVYARVAEGSKSLIFRKYVIKDENESSTCSNEIKIQKQLMEIKKTTQINSPYKKNEQILSENERRYINSKNESEMEKGIMYKDKKMIKKERSKSDDDWCGSNSLSKKINETPRKQINKIKKMEGHENIASDDENIASDDDWSTPNPLPKKMKEDFRKDRNSTIKEMEIRKSNVSDDDWSETKSVPKKEKQRRRSITNDDDWFETKSLTKKEKEHRRSKANDDDWFQTKSFPNKKKEHCRSIANDDDRSETKSLSKKEKECKRKEIEKRESNANDDDWSETKSITKKEKKFYKNKLAKERTRSEDEEDWSEIKSHFKKDKEIKKCENITGENKMDKTNLISENNKEIFSKDKSKMKKQVERYESIKSDEDCSEINPFPKKVKALRKDRSNMEKERERGESTISEDEMTETKLMSKKIKENHSKNKSKVIKYVSRRGISTSEDTYEKKNLRVDIRKYKSKTNEDDITETDLLQKKVKNMEQEEDQTQNSENTSSDNDFCKAHPLPKRVKESLRRYEMKMKQKMYLSNLSDDETSEDDVLPNNNISKRKAEFPSNLYQYKDNADINETRILRRIHEEMKLKYNLITGDSTSNERNKINENNYKKNVLDKQKKENKFKVKRRMNDSENTEIKKPTENYVPPEPPKNEEIFKTTIKSGINFHKYESSLIKITGKNKSKMITSFKEIEFYETVMNNIKKASYVKPTPVQRAALPAITIGRDVIACAQTGSGKTAAYLLPVINQLLLYPREIVVDKNHCEPQVLIVAPTRELVIQIKTEAQKFSYGTNLKVNFIYGGTSERHQLKEIAKGCHILVATPGRLDDFISRECVTFSSIRFVVLDEADELLDNDFYPIIKNIFRHKTMEPAGRRQTLMFSATFPNNLQLVAAHYLYDYLFISVGTLGGVCSDINQNIFKLSEQNKEDKLLEILEKNNMNKIIIFVNTKLKAESLHKFLDENNYMAYTMHDDRLQSEREAALMNFRHGRCNILIATNVAARGLDINEVHHVINFDMPRDISDYVHRIGRTARVGNWGKATSFFNPSRDFNLATPLIEVLTDTGLPVPEWLVKPYRMRRDSIEELYAVDYDEALEIENNFTWNSGDEL